MRLLASEVNADYYTHPLGIVSLLMVTIPYIHYIHMQGRFNNHTVVSFYRIMVTATNVVVVMKMGNTTPRAGLEPTPLAFQASASPLHHVGSLTSPL